MRSWRRIQDKTKYTPEEYPAREEKAEYKSEYYDGEIRMMSGGTAEHSIVKGNIVTALNIATQSMPCQLYDSDMRLLVSPQGSYVYPDAMVVCGKTIFQEGRRDVATNPIRIVEVLSPTRREHDRIEKFKLYKQIESLREYVLIDSERVVVSVLRREMTTGKWTIEILNTLSDILVLESLQIEIPLTRIYSKIDFPIDPETNAG